MNRVDDIIAVIDTILKDETSDLKKRLQKMGLVNIESTISCIEEYEDLLAGLLEDELKFFVDLINEGCSVEDALEKVLASFSKDVLASEVESQAKEFYENFMADTTLAYMTLVDSDAIFDTFSDYTKDFMKEWSKSLGEHLQDTSHKKIEKILTKGIEDGSSIDDICDILQDNYDWSRERARKVAITETLTAHSYSQHEAFMQSPVVTGMKWKHSGTKKNDARKHHQKLNGVIVNKGELFTIDAPDGKYTCKFPRDVNLPPSERIHCHCTVGPVVDNDILGMTQEEKEELRKEALEDWNKNYKSSKNT